MTLSEAEINEKIEEEGAVRVLVTFEVAGKPKSHVDETLTLYTDKLKEDKAVNVLDIHREKAIELEDEDEGFFSAFAEVEMLLADLEDLTHISVNLMPASVEVLAPEKFSFEARDMQNWTNDLLSRLHEIAQQVRTEKQRAAHLNKNMRALMQNLVRILLINGPKTEQELSRLTGIESKVIQRVMKDMQEQQTARKEDDKWVLHEKEK